MPLAFKTKRRTKLEKRAAEVIGYLSEAKSCNDVARIMDCAVTSVIKFRDRHAEEIEERRQYYLNAVEQYDIAHKGRRIAELDRLQKDAAAYQDEHGLQERSVRYDQKGNLVGETYHFARDLVAEQRQLLRAAAEQLGQLPRPEVNVQTNIVLVRNVAGPDVDALG